MIAHMYDGQLCMLSGRACLGKAEEYPYSAAVSTKLTEHESELASASRRIRLTITSSSAELDYISAVLRQILKNLLWQKNQ